MVVLDLDHPDIEEFINWKVVEEQKVAALVTGSQLLNKHLNAILQGVPRWHAIADERFDPTQERRPAQGDPRRPRVAASRRTTSRACCNWRKQGFTSIEVEEYDTDWNSKAYYTVSGQNSNNSVRITNAFMKAVETDGPWHLYWRTEKEKADDGGPRPEAVEDAAGPRPVGPDRLRRVELRRPRRAVRHHHQRVAHLPGRRADQREQPVLANTCSSTTRRATSRR